MADFGDFCAWLRTKLLHCGNDTVLPVPLGGRSIKVMTGKARPVLHLVSQIGSADEAQGAPAKAGATKKMAVKAKA